jgi:2-dehydropantoate 2-reductase
MTSTTHYPRRICVAGCGAIGGVLAARLAAAGHEVSVLARGAQLAEICKAGLRLTDLAGTFSVKVAASDRARFGVQDVVFVSCKAHAMGSMLLLIEPLVRENTVVVPTVNGIPWWYFQGQGGPLEGQAVSAVDPNGALLGALSWTRIVGCVVYMAAEVKAPGCIVAISPHRMMLGEPSNQPSERAALLCGILNAAGIAATATDRIRDEIWTKLLGNLASNPLSVLTGATLEDQADDPDLRAIFLGIGREILAVGTTYGASFAVDPPGMVEICRKFGPFKTSMLQDFEKGRPLELAAIGDTVVELASKHDISMPVTRAILSLARFCDAHRPHQSIQLVARSRDGDSGPPPREMRV